MKIIIHLPVIMPVPHNLFRSEEDEGEEFYGPWDGVRPTDYPEVYRKLSTLFCVQPWTLHIYEAETHRICEICWGKLQRHEQAVFTEGGWHSVCVNQSLRKNCTCEVCGSRIAVHTPATECSECIEEYFEMDRETWIQVEAGKTVDVITRW